MQRDWQHIKQWLGRAPAGGVHTRSQSPIPASPSVAGSGCCCPSASAATTSSSPNSSWRVGGIVSTGSRTCRGRGAGGVSRLLRGEHVEGARGPGRATFVGVLRPVDEVVAVAEAEQQQQQRAAP